MSYPFDGDKRFENLSNFELIRNKFFYPLFGISITALLLSQIQIFKPFFDIFQPVDFLLIALALGSAFGLTFTISAKVISSAYNEKAGFEAVLYNLLCEIENDDKMSEEVRCQIYMSYLKDIMYRPGRRQHLQNLPTQPRNNLAETINTLQRIEVSRLQKRLGVPDSVSSQALGSSAEYCRNLEAMLEEIRNTKTGTDEAV